MFNRRALLAAIGLTLPAFAVAEAATTKKKIVKKPAHGPRVVSHKPTHKPSAKPPAAQS
jgi:hypothetical protein